MGWKEREGIEKLEEKYLKWVLGVDRRIPGYMIREELQKKKITGKARKRACIEKKMIEGGGSKLARRFWKKIREREKRRKRKKN